MNIMDDMGSGVSVDIETLRGFDKQLNCVIADFDGNVYIPVNQVTLEEFKSKYPDAAPAEPQQLELFKPLEEPVEPLPITMDHYRPMTINHIGGRHHSNRGYTGSGKGDFH